MAYFGSLADQCPCDVAVTILPPTNAGGAYFSREDPFKPVVVLLNKFMPPEGLLSTLAHEMGHIGCARVKCECHQVEPDEEHGYKMIHNPDSERHANIKALNWMRNRGLWDEIEFLMKGIYSQKNVPELDEYILESSKQLRTDRIWLECRHEIQKRRQAEIDECLKD
jgi:hypothetical protein